MLANQGENPLKCAYERKPQYPGIRTKGDFARALSALYFVPRIHPGTKWRNRYRSDF